MHFCAWLCLFSMEFRHWGTTFKTHFHPGDQITIDKFQNGKPPAENVFEPGNVEKPYRVVITRRCFHTEKPAHRETITQSSFYTKQLLHTDASTDRRF